MATYPIRTRHWSRREYDHLVELGVPHEDEQVELIGADSSIAFDRRYKGSLYARAGIADYWIVNVRRRVLEVYREPVPAPAARFGWKFDRVRILKPEATVSPLVLPDATTAVADLLP